MNREDLIQHLGFVSQPEIEIQIIIYAILKEEEFPRKLDIKETDLPSLADMFLKSIKKKIIENDTFSILALSTADERTNCYYEYDLDLPVELQNLESVIGNDDISIFSFNNHNIQDIDSLIIVISQGDQQISLFKKLSTVEIIGPSGYLVWKSNQRLEKFEDSLLRISPNFQAILVNNTVVILDLKFIERSFGFIDVIKREALLGLNAIRDINIISNLNTLEELVDDITFARKLTKIARNSPVIQKSIPNTVIITFTETHPALKGKIRYNDTKTQINLHTKTAKNLFVKLLNDDFLTSELTSSYYDSLAKDNIDLIEEEIN
ncbi:uncharacterized protein DUF4868 [Dysgonomonas alginatilytica]|uniref:Uncharacterized protein DUF4868 n=1 Tax=Dysgonomonas alginatilytica TaxID=1605892 RepID=A0A2V3PLA9_9BACT|nr:anti-phage protein KwaB [Dysgonomonas alginatilytica]PXV60128.1 uncharacterized protein DUF4868 [Dysgonomonas alginatilytica]